MITIQDLLSIVYLRKVFAFCRDVSITNTRSAQTDLRLPLVKTDISKAKIFYSGASLFNSLPSDLKTIGFIFYNKT
jgi:hypothetical protein